MGKKFSQNPIYNLRKCLCLVYDIEKYSDQQTTFFFLICITGCPEIHYVVGVMLLPQPPTCWNYQSKYIPFLASVKQKKILFLYKCLAASQNQNKISGWKIFANVCIIFF